MRIVLKSFTQMHTSCHFDKEFTTVFIPPFYIFPPGRPEELILAQLAQALDAPAQDLELALCLRRQRVRFNSMSVS